MSKQAEMLRKQAAYNAMKFADQLIEAHERAIRELKDRRNMLEVKLSGAASIGSDRSLAHVSVLQILSSMITDATVNVQNNLDLNRVPFIVAQLVVAGTAE